MKTMRKAFSVPELLIVLILLGVVVSFTLSHLKSSSLVQESAQTAIKNEHSTISLKKVQQTLQKIEMMSIRINGPMSDWDWDFAAFEKYFIPSMNVAKKCKNIESGCFVDELASGLKINTERFVRVLTVDGVAYAYDTANRVIYVDINALNAPNKLGEDIFQLEIHPDRGIVLIE